MDLKLLMMVVMLTVVFGMIALAFAGPDAGKAQARRIATIRGRHSPSASASVEAQIRKALSSRQRTTGINASSPDSYRLWSTQNHSTPFRARSHSRSGT